MLYAPVEPRVKWLSGKRFWQKVALAFAVLAVAIGLSAWYIERGADADLPTLEVVGPAAVVAGEDVDFRVVVRDGNAGRALAGAEVRATLGRLDGRARNPWPARTDADGLAIVRTRFADVEGTQTISFTAFGPRNEAGVSAEVSVVRAARRAYVATDKPIYQPGQTIHVRALVFVTPGDKPAAGEPATIEISDPKDNKVHKVTGTISEFGIVATDLALADQVNLGDYKIAVRVGEAVVGTAKVQVARYALPKLRVDLALDAAGVVPGQALTGSVRALYTFGEPAAGAAVTLGVARADDERAIVEVKQTTNAEGRLAFSLLTPQQEGDYQLTCRVESPDGEERTQTAAVRLSRAPLEITVVPEGSRLVPGVENIVYVVVRGLGGAPVRANVRLSPAGVSASTSDLGVAAMKLVPSDEGGAWTFEASAEDGRKAAVSFTPEIDRRPGALLTRPDRSLYRPGDELRLRVESASSVPRRLRVDLFQAGKLLATTTTSARAAPAEIPIRIPEGAAGTLEVEAMALGVPGEIARSARRVQVARRDDLAVELRADRGSYKPGDTATLDLTVRARGGTPVLAALGIVGVDESVFLLHDVRPGLEQLFFALPEVKPPQPSYPYAKRGRWSPPRVPSGPPPARALTVDERQALIDPDRDLAREVLLSSTVLLPTANRQVTRLEEVRSAARNEADRGLRRLGGLTLLVPFALSALLSLLVFAHGLTRAARPAPVAEASEEHLGEWHRAMGSLMRRHALALLGPIGLVLVAAYLVDAFHLHGHDEAILALVGAASIAFFILPIPTARKIRTLPLTEAMPFLRAVLWAVPASVILGYLGLVLLIAGERSVRHAFPEEILFLAALAALLLGQLVFGALAVVRAAALAPLGLARRVWLLLSRPAFAGLPLLLLLGAMLFRGAAKTAAPTAVMADRAARMESGAGAPAGALDSKGGAAKSPADEGPRVRRHFPETLLWLPELKTDANGHAKVEVPLADSITTWRLSASAVTRAGQLGSLTTPIKVFQDFFVDAVLPPTLTRGDEVTVPVSVFNYLDAPQEVRIEVKAAPWLRVVGKPDRKVTLAAREVASVPLRIRAEEAGAQALSIEARGSAMSDAVERKVDVVPEGRRIERVDNGSLAGSASVSLAYPADAIRGSADLTLKLYAGTFSQLAESLRGIFRMPHGCFEQTSSTTYPSILALEFLKRAGRASPALEAEARRTIQAGYQRLLTFEVAGGGFDWFGHAPAHVTLTAYGLLEFHDMSRVLAVDPDLLRRTRDWLYTQQQPSGWWEEATGHAASSAVSTRRGDKLLTTAYVAWALAETGERGDRIGRALDMVARGDAAGADDPYALALRANALLAGERKAEAHGLLEKLVPLAVREGEALHWRSTSEGVTWGRGESLAEETTALAAHALFRDGDGRGTARLATSWLASRRGAHGTWSSTQATIHALRALLDEVAADAPGDQTVSVTVNGKPAGEVTIPKDARDVFRLLSLREHARAGEAQVRLALAGGGAVLYQVVASHHVPWKPAAPRDLPIALAVDYGNKTVHRGETLPCHVSVTWRRETPARMPVLELGVPPGLEAVSEDLEKLVTSRSVDRYTVGPRGVTLYLPEMKPAAAWKADVRLRGLYPVLAAAPASRVYPYYEPEIAAETAPTVIEVADAGR